MARGQKRTLPFGSQFSPEQVELARVLTIASRHEGDVQGLNEETRQAFFSAHAGGDHRQQLELAKNVRLALRDYGLLDDDTRLTDVGKRLLALAAQPDQMYKEFARHILLNLRGLEFVNTIRDMTAAGESITLPSLHKRLAERGLYFSSTGTHASSLKGWLVTAGIMEKGRGFVVNEAALSQILGIDVEDADAIEGLTVEQQAFLKALCNFPEAISKKHIRVSDLVNYAETLYGVEFPRKALVKQILAPVENLGFIVTRKATTGRGAKPTEIMVTERFVRERLAPVISALEKTIGPAIRQVARMSLANILEGVRASDVHRKGLALEALAIYLFRLLDLDFVKWRLRGKATGGAEVDVIVEGASVPTGVQVAIPYIWPCSPRLL